MLNYADVINVGPSSEYIDRLKVFKPAIDELSVALCKISIAFEVIL
jgi:hypothetical protein